MTDFSTSICEALKAMGWTFCYTGPDEWTWLKFDMGGSVIAHQGDLRWRKDTHTAAAAYLKETTAND